MTAKQTPTALLRIPFSPWMPRSHHAGRADPVHVADRSQRWSSLATPQGKAIEGKRPCVVSGSVLRIFGLSKKTSLPFHSAGVLDESKSANDYNRHGDNASVISESAFQTRANWIPYRSWGISRAAKGVTLWLRALRAMLAPPSAVRMRSSDCARSIPALCGNTPSPVHFRPASGRSAR